MTYESWRWALNWPSLPCYIFLYMKKWRFRGVNYLLKSASLIVSKRRAQISRSWACVFYPIATSPNFSPEALGRWVGVGIGSWISRSVEIISLKNEITASFISHFPRQHGCSTFWLWGGLSQAPRYSWAPSLYLVSINIICLEQETGLSPGPLSLIGSVASAGCGELQWACSAGVGSDCCWGCSSANYIPSFVFRGVLQDHSAPGQPSTRRQL